MRQSRLARHSLSGSNFITDDPVDRKCILISTPSLYRVRMRMNKTGSNTNWEKHIRNRVRLAQQWRNENGLETHKRLAERFIYIRINGSKFRPVSISPDNPCGRLVRKTDRAELKGSANIRRAIQAAEDAMPADCFAPAGGRKNAKPEHRIQASLIRCALQNNLVLSEPV